jgi:hypothetical protein
MEAARKYFFSFFSPRYLFVVSVFNTEDLKILIVLVGFQEGVRAKPR